MMMRKGHHPSGWLLLFVVLSLLLLRAVVDAQTSQQNCDPARFLHHIEFLPPDAQSILWNAGAVAGLSSTTFRGSNLQPASFLSPRSTATLSPIVVATGKRFPATILRAVVYQADGATLGPLPLPSSSGGSTTATSVRQSLAQGNWTIAVRQQSFYIPPSVPSSPLVTSSIQWVQNLTFTPETGLALFQPSLPYEGLWNFTFELRRNGLPVATSDILYSGSINVTNAEVDPSSQNPIPSYLQFGAGLAAAEPKVLWGSPIQTLNVTTPHEQRFSTLQVYGSYRERSRIVSTPIGLSSQTSAAVGGQQGNANTKVLETGQRRALRDTVTTSIMRPTVMWENQTVMGTKDTPLPPFAVDVFDNTFNRWRNNSAGGNVEGYVVRAEVIDLAFGDFATTQGLTNHTVPVGNDGRAIFTSLTPSGVFRDVVIRLSLFRDGGARRMDGVMSLCFQWRIELVPQPGATLAFASHHSVRAIALEAAAGSDSGSGLTVAEGVSLPAFTVHCIDSSGNLDEYTSGAVVVAVSENGATMTGNKAQLIAGRAVFSGLAFTPGTVVTGYYYRVWFRVSSTNRRLSNATAVGLPLISRPILLSGISPTALTTPLIQRIRFDPRNPFVPDEGLGFRAALLRPVSPIAVQLVDQQSNLLDANLFKPDIRVRVFVQPLFNTPVDRAITLHGTLEKDFVGGAAVFDDLSFSGATQNGLRLVFEALDPSSGSSPRPVHRFRISTGKIDVYVSHVATALLRFSERTQETFLGPNEYDNRATLSGGSGFEDTSTVVAEESLVPLIVLKVYRSDGTVNLAENELSVTAEVVGGICALHNAVAFARRGEVVFAKLRIFGCDHSKLSSASDIRTRLSAIRLRFTAGSEGQQNLVQGQSVTSGLIHLLPSSSAASKAVTTGLNAPTAPAALRLTQTSYLYQDWQEFLDRIPLPPVTLQLVPADCSLMRPKLFYQRNGDVKTAATAPTGLLLANVGIVTVEVIIGDSGRHDSSSQTSASIDTQLGTSNGLLVFDRIRIVTTRPGVRSVSVAFCAKTKSVVISCIVRHLLLADSMPRQLYVSIHPPQNMTLRANTGVGNFSTTLVYGQWTFAGQLGGATTGPNATFVLSSPVSVVDAATNTSQRPASTTGVTQIRTLALRDLATLPIDEPFTVTFSAVGADFGPETSPTPSPRTRRVATTAPIYLDVPLPDRTAVADAAQLVVFLYSRLTSQKEISQWRLAMARHFNTALDRLHLTRVAPARRSKIGSRFTATGTRMELFVKSPPMSDGLKTPTSLIQDQLLAYKETCAVTEHVAIDVVVEEGTDSVCDEFLFRDRVEAARHCEAFRSINERCTCFAPMFYDLGDACKTTSLALSTCDYVSACNDDKIQSVCSDVVPNVVLRIVIVIGGTLGALLVVVVIIKLRRKKHPLAAKAKLSTGQPGSMEMPRQTHDDIFLE